MKAKRTDIELRKSRITVRSMCVFLACSEECVLKVPSLPNPRPAVRDSTPMAVPLKWSLTLTPVVFPGQCCLLSGAPLFCGPTLAVIPLARFYGALAW